MANNIKFLIIVALLAALVGGFIYYYANFSDVSKNETITDKQKTKSLEEIPVPTATGDIDKTIDALLEEMSIDSSAFIQEEDDRSLLSSDSQAISNLGQSYDENEF